MIGMIKFHLIPHSRHNKYTVRAKETRLQGRNMWPHPRNGGVGHNNKQREELRTHKQMLT